jgi:uncharacterized protein (AIM24 family)
MQSTLFSNVERQDQEHAAFVLQNNHTLLVNLDGEVYAKQGSMAAYQGEVDFSFTGGGVGRMLKKLVTGENLQFMKCTGKGDVFLADNGSEVHIVELTNEELTINGSNLLAFESGLQWDIKLIRAGIMGAVAGGLFNATLTGSGHAAISSWGTPFVLRIDQPTFVDVGCVIAWTSSLQVQIKSSLKAGALIGRGSGEAFQMGFSGDGFVVVQPGEGIAALALAKN